MWLVRFYFHVTSMLRDYNACFDSHARIQFDPIYTCICSIRIESPEWHKQTSVFLWMVKTSKQMIERWKTDYWTQFVNFSHEFVQIDMLANRPHLHLLHTQSINLLRDSVSQNMALCTLYNIHWKNRYFFWLKKICRVCWWTSWPSKLVHFSTKWAYLHSYFWMNTRINNAAFTWFGSFSC